MRKTVLVVDDDQDDLAMMQEALSLLETDHQLVLAVDGKDGWDKLENLAQEQGLPCLIVLDLNMPNLNGRDTFQLIKSNPKYADIPVVIFSTSSSAMDKLYFARYNAPFFTKPVNFHLFVAIASQILNHCLHNK